MTDSSARSKNERRIEQASWKERAGGALVFVWATYTFADGVRDLQRGVATHDMLLASPAMAFVGLLFAVVGQPRDERGMTSPWFKPAIVVALVAGALVSAWIDYAFSLERVRPQ